MSELLIQFLRDPLLGWEPLRLSMQLHFELFYQCVMNQRKYRSVIERGFTIETANAKLTTILAEDAFLAQCCGDIEHLAHALDLLFFTRLPASTYTGSIPSLGFRPTPYELGIEQLEQSLDGHGAFTKTAYFHLYNFWARP